MRQIVFVAAATAAALLVSPLRAAEPTPDTGDAPAADMRILRTPDEVLFRVRLGEPGKRLRAAEISGAKGWAVPLAQKNDAADTWPTPATDGGKVFVGGALHSSEFYALSADDGRLAWKANLNDNGPTPAVVRDRRVYFNTQSCTTYAYDTRTGRRAWSRYLAGTLESIPAVTDDVLVTTRPDRSGERDRDLVGVPALTILDLAGRVKADVTIDDQALGAPALHAGHAYVATRRGSLVCVSTEDGIETWRQDVQARGAPWVDDSGVYICARDSLRAFHLETGRPRWSDAAITPSSRDAAVPERLTPPPVRSDVIEGSQTRSFWREGPRPVVANGRLCLAEGNAIRMFDRVTGAETAYWELDVEGPFRGSPLVCGNTLVVATHGGQVRGVDVRHGEIVWGVDLDRPLGSGVVVDAGRLFAVTRDGTLVCVNTGHLGADGWPMWGGTPENGHTTR